MRGNHNMKNLAVINAINLSGYALEPLPGLQNALSAVLDYTAGLPEVDSSLLLADGDFAATTDVKVVKKNRWTVEELIGTLIESGRDFDNVIYYYADCPFLDLDVTLRMYESHNRYYAQYNEKTICIMRNKPIY